MHPLLKELLRQISYAPLLPLFGLAVPITSAAAQANYTYLAETTAPVVKSGNVLAGGLKWECWGSQCTTTGPWPSLGVGTCTSLRDAVGPIKSYGRRGSQLSVGDLEKCNAGGIVFLNPGAVLPLLLARPSSQSAAAATSATVGARCDSHDDCDDGVFCNGVEVCRLRFHGFSFRGNCEAGAPVVCDDGIACSIDSCSETMRTCDSVAPDADGDGHGEQSCADRSGASLGDDCDDADVNRFPGRAEHCDDHDEDCNPLTIGFKDDDLDGQIDRSCTNPRADGEEEAGPDCNDRNRYIYGGAPEFCNEIDDDCDGTIDNSPVLTSKVWEDGDRDGFGNRKASPQFLCLQDLRGFSLNDYDCDDADARRHPGANCP